jgi:hypothetical protein
MSLGAAAQSTNNNGTFGTTSPGASILESTAPTFAQENATANANQNALDNVPNRSALITTQGGDGGVVGAIPEPETYVLMLSGLGLVMWATRRRKKGKEQDTRK